MIVVDYCPYLIRLLQWPQIIRYFLRRSAAAAAGFCFAIVRILLLLLPGIAVLYISNRWGLLLSLLFLLRTPLKTIQEHPTRGRRIPVGRTAGVVMMKMMGGASSLPAWCWCCCLSFSCPLNAMLHERVWYDPVRYDMVRPIVPNILQYDVWQVAKVHQLIN